MATSLDKRRAAIARIKPEPRLDAETLAHLQDMSDQEALQNAVDDADAPPSTRDQLAQGRRNREKRLATRDA